MTGEGTTTQAKGSEFRVAERLVVSLADHPASFAWPNKPMVATATTQLANYPPDSGRRHIGQPLGAYEQRATKEQASGHGLTAQASNEDCVEHR